MTNKIDNWKPEDVDNEARHLAKDRVILFLILLETYGIGFLSEIGFLKYNPHVIG
jgi:hypothetical protein